jgi:hypothetical protein
LREATVARLDRGSEREYDGLVRQLGKVIVVTEQQANALRHALKEIRKDPKAREEFRADPQKVVRDLDDQAAAVFKNMSDLEMACIAWVDENMEAAGFTHEIDGVSVRMV